MGPESIDRIFWDAAQLTSPAERDAYLARACDGDAELRRRVEQLLHARSEAESFLESPAPDLDATVEECLLPEGPGTEIGPYKLLEPIGKGSFGVVFLAEQTQPLRRKVALKVLKPGMDTRQVVARFEAERQALALMDHPNIARVLDAGAVPSGRPYFVMELVKGAPITDFCDERRLTTRERLGLFVSICQAVQHAHQKGIIHRDLKPSNILVTVQDGAAVPKVIDFGVAKTLGQQLTERTLFTGFAQVLGTPLYMSPEQARMSGQDVDTRSDVYSLGVLLYELLTGTTPLEKERARRLDLDELRQAIREEEPPRPSTRAGTAGEAAATAAMRRQSDPKRLSGLLRGELDWVVMRALEKDRDRRYESASAFAADVQRYLHDEPVQACPPSRWYRFRKLVRRNKRAFLAAGLVLLTLVDGIIATSWQAVRATRAKQLAQTRLGQIEKANDVLASVFRNIDPDSEATGGPSLQEQLRQRLGEAAGELSADAVGDAETVARLQHTLGVTLLQLGDYRQAIELLGKARATRDELLGPDNPDTLASMNRLGDAYIRDGQGGKAAPLLEQTVERQAARLGPEHAATLASMDNLARAYQRLGRLDKAVPLYEQVLEKRQAVLGPDHLDTISSMNNLGQAYQPAGKLDKALPLLKQALAKLKEKRGPNHPATLISLNNLGVLYFNAGRPDKALPLLEETVAGWKERLRPDHPRTLFCMNNLAAAYESAGQQDKALALYEQTWQLQKARLGPGHQDTLMCMNNLGTAYGRTGHLDRALPLLAETVRLREKALGRNHPDTLLTMTNLGDCYRHTGRLADATSLLEEVMDRAHKRPGGFPPAGLHGAFSSLAWTYDEAGQSARAEPLHREYLQRIEKQFGPDHARTAGALAGLGQNLLKQGKYAESEAALRRCLGNHLKRSPGPSKSREEWQAFEARSLLGGALLGQKKYAEAGPLLREAYEGLKQREKNIPPYEKARLGQAAERLVRLYEATGEKEKAAEWRRELEAQRASQKKPPTPR
jgi:serine/threonine protein kinase